MRDNSSVGFIWLFLTCLLMSVSVDAKELTISLEPAGHSPAGIENPLIQVIAESPSGVHVETSRQGFGHLSLDLPETENTWTLRAFAGGYWSAPELVTKRPDASAGPFLRLVMRRSVEVVGSLVRPPGESAPELLQVRFDPADPAEKRPPPADEATCRIFTEQERERFACTVPAGFYDLRLRPRGFVSHYFWDRRLRPDQDLDLGTVVLEPGSSVAGFIETEDGGPLRKDLQVELRPQVHGGQSSVDAKLRRFTHFAKVNEKGFFHFPGVAEGMYGLYAEQKGYAAAEAGGVNVVKGFESRLRDPLILTPPREIDVRILPRKNTQGGHWRIGMVHLRRAKNELVGDTICDDLGFCSLGGLPSGRFILTVHEESSEKAFYHQEISLEGPTTFLDLELPLVEIEGTFRLGDESASPLLRFGGSFSPNAIEIQVDEDGSFHGFLSREGEWKVEIENEDPPIHRSLRKVMVRRKSGREIARVDFQISDLKMKGSVVDEAMQPQVRPIIIFRPEGADHDEFAIRADEEGQFTLRGMEPGLVHLRASTRELKSDVAVVELHKAMEPPPITLVVKPRRVIQGVVLSDSGPVPGASLRARRWGALIDDSDSAVTDAQGNFELTLLRDTEAVHLEIQAPGHAFSLARYDLPENGFLVVEVGKNWGELEIRLPPGDEQELWVQIAREGASVEVRTLMYWARLYVSEGRVESGYALVPRMAPGLYRICYIEPGSVEWMSLYMQGQAAPKSFCRDAELVPFGRQSVDLRENESDTVP